MTKLPAPLTIASLSPYRVPEPGATVPLMYDGREIGEARLLGNDVAIDVTDQAAATVVRDLIAHQAPERAEFSMGFWTASSDPDRVYLKIRPDDGHATCTSDVHV